MHQIREILSKAAAQSDGGNLGYAVADAVKVIDGVLSIPSTLPCPVHLETGLKFGKGVRTQCVLDALRRRADYYAELEAMTPERDVDVQVYCADKKEQMVGYMERNETEGWFRFASLPNGGGVYCKPTHWMPLPAAPQQEVK
ncbi:DUF551 domain-containing protein [Salmonella enterica subsp. enterica]|nr:DUF551 domain-containing protein [Salmonella enterica subsp. enterica]